MELFKSCGELALENWEVYDGKGIAPIYEAGHFGVKVL